MCRASRRAGAQDFEPTGIGFVFQAFHLLAHRNVTENVVMSMVYNPDAAFVTPIPGA